MVTCEWTRTVCTNSATQTVDISFPEGNRETWQVCREHEKELKLYVVRERPKAPPTHADPPPTVTVECGECHRALDESAATPDAERQPCPACGSLPRLLNVAMVDSLHIHESLKVQIKQSDKGRWMTSVKTGDDYTRDLEAWGTRELDIDRAQNRYREVIRFYDGTVIESRARLSDHQG